MNTAYCMKCQREGLPTGQMCRRDGSPWFDNGADHAADVDRFEGQCLRCCGHNHG